MTPLDDGRKCHDMKPGPRMKANSTSGCGSWKGVILIESTRTPIRPLVVGNWKMNGLKASVTEAVAVRDTLAAHAVNAEVMLAPPATMVMVLAELLKGSSVGVAAQDCHCEPAGAFTGDVSAQMLRDAGAGAVIIGHSERS
jgi:triosephosphate isomerase (TIM)